MTECQVLCLALSPFPWRPLRSWREAHVEGAVAEMGVRKCGHPRSPAVRGGQGGAENASIGAGGGLKDGQVSVQFGPEMAPDGVAECTTTECQVLCLALSSLPWRPLRSWREAHSEGAVAEMGGRKCGHPRSPAIPGGQGGAENASIGAGGGLKDGQVSVQVGPEMAPGGVAENDRVPGPLSRPLLPSLAAFAVMA